MLNDIVSVGRDGVGGAMARRHACIYRVDVLKQGKNVKGQPVIAEEEIKDHIGNGIGFSCKTVSLFVSFYHCASSSFGLSSLFPFHYCYYTEV